MSWRVDTKYADCDYVIFPAPWNKLTKIFYRVLSRIDEIGIVSSESEFLGLVAFCWSRQLYLCVYVYNTLQHRLLYWSRPNVELIIVRAYCLLQSRSECVYRENDQQMCSFRPIDRVKRRKVAHAHTHRLADTRINIRVTGIERYVCMHIRWFCNRDRANT